VLLVDPDERSRRAVHLLLDRRGLVVSAVATVELARRWLAETTCDAILADAGLVAALVGGPPVIALASAGEVDVGQGAIRAGAADCLVGLPSDDDLALALFRASRTLGHIPIAARNDAGLDRLIGASAPMRALRATLERIAPHRSTVLVSGESGTGKELVARAIHELSPRAGRRFVAINCAAIPAALLESELFGHRRGAFTDAIRDKAGLFEDADGGTLFLDEIGELPLGLQVKLLRAIQESEIRRVGDTVSIRVDVRLVAATLRDLAVDVKSGRFREDLFYRLNVLPVSVPPLRERPDDVPLLVDHFVRRHQARHGPSAEFTEEAIAVMARRPWPGNVRELENAVERTLVLAESPRIGAELMMESLRPGRAGAEIAELSIKKATRALEVDLIRQALLVTRGNRTSAARLLEISHRALLYKLKDYGLS
jgi:two-component system response regulator AtoC